ncbi:metallopeptidase family protein [Methyloceanibacter sp. wino2]|uniref:metallopeptidase family protein n=1 Tax=Methyloceanibacter sp. wino2 TaxID=2170729 RepID=UPI000D3E0C61|nr:metallopeptidase family protein [Methyloceanibacter sp. wino2]
MTQSHHHRVPDLADFEAVANQTFAQLPATFRDMTQEVVIRVEDFPASEVLESLHIDSPYGLLGLYHGIDLTRQSVLDVSPLPEMIFLYRRPILAYWQSHDEALEDIIAHVLIHEIGHHFGLSDDDMERIESEAAG